MRGSQPLSGAISILLLAAGGALAPAASVEVRLEVPRPPRIDPEVKGYTSISIAPFLDATKKGRTDYAFNREAKRYFARLFRKKSNLEVLAEAAASLPFSTVEELIHDTGFWKRQGEQSHADLLLTGMVSYHTENRSGYVSRSGRSQTTGRAYQERPVFVYRMGIVLELHIVLVEGKSGKVLYHDRFLKDKTLEGTGGDPLQNFFDLMRDVSPSILGILTTQKTSTTRYLLE